MNLLMVQRAQLAQNIEILIASPSLRHHYSRVLRWMKSRSTAVQIKKRSRRTFQDSLSVELYWSNQFKSIEWFWSIRQKTITQHLPRVLEPGFKQIKHMTQDCLKKIHDAKVNYEVLVTFQMTSWSTLLPQTTTEHWLGFQKQIWLAIQPTLSRTNWMNKEMAMFKKRLTNHFSAPWKL